MSRDEPKAGTKVLVEAVVSDPTYWHGGVIVNVGRLMANVKRKEIHPFPGVQEWRPIESAPKDGSGILLAMGKYVGEGFYHDGSQCYGHRGKAGFFWEADRTHLLTADNAYAFHWQPLPPPPSSAEQGEGGGR